MMIVLRCLLVLATTAVTLGGHAAAANPTMLLLGADISGSEIFAVGGRGTILSSPDSGTTWKRVASPTETTLTAISFSPDGQHGWAVGHDALIIATSDRGASWQQVFQGANEEDSFLDVCAIDADHIIAIGAYGLYRQSADGGETWQQRSIQDEDSHLNRITRGRDGTLYIAGERGSLLRSVDRGNSWQSIASDYAGSFYGILPLGNRQLLAYGLRGRVFRSNNDGDQWTPIPTQNNSLIATACRTPDEVIVMAGQPRTFLLSRDSGASFVRWALPSTMGVSFLLVAPDGRLLAFGESGVVFLHNPKKL